VAADGAGSALAETAAGAAAAEPSWTADLPAGTDSPAATAWSAETDSPAATAWSSAPVSADEDSRTDGAAVSGPADAASAAVAASAAARPEPAATGRVFDAATTRRRSVVFEEDDDLDIPDFLK
jgi:cell division protein FtsZ